jgi:hypothetical protein
VLVAAVEGSMTTSSDIRSGAEAVRSHGATAGDVARSTRAWLVPLLRQAAMVVTALVLYNLVRVLTEGSEEEAFRHARHLLDLEDGLGIAWERSAQEVVLARPHLVSFFNAVYTWAFWPTVVAALTILYVRDRARYHVMRDALFVSGAIGLVIFASFPVAPPRFLDGFVDTVADLSTHEVVAHPGMLVNRYAAMPSFHVGWMLLAAIVVRPALPRRPIQVIPFALAALMVATVVVTANHYVVDAAAGILVSAIGLVVARRIDRRRQRRALALAELVPAEPAAPDVVLLGHAGRGAERPDAERAAG